MQHICAIFSISPLSYPTGFLQSWHMIMLDIEEGPGSGRTAFGGKPQGFPLAANTDGVELSTCTGCWFSLNLTPCVTSPPSGPV